MQRSNCGEQIWSNQKPQSLHKMNTSSHMACSTVYSIFLFTISMFPNYTHGYVQILVQMVLLGWLYMADILENPFGFNQEFDINLDEVTTTKLQILYKKQELELNIWRCSVTIQQQSVGKSGSENTRKKLQRKIWELIRPATANSAH